MSCIQGFNSALPNVRKEAELTKLPQPSGTQSSPFEAASFRRRLSGGEIAEI